MSILAILLSCSLYSDDALVRAIAESAHDSPFDVVDPESDPEIPSVPSPPRTLEAGLAQLQALTARGAVPLVGLLHVPVAWASNFGRQEKDVFDACINVSIGSAMLSTFDAECARASKAPERTRRACVLHRYAEAIHLPALELTVALSLRSAKPSALVTDAPILARTADRPHWGNSCLLFPIGPRSLAKTSDASTP